MAKKKVPKSFELDATVQSLRKVLESEPWLTLKALADRLEELGEGSKAQALHYLIASKRLPYYNHHNFNYGWSWSDAEFPPSHLSPGYNTPWFSFYDPTNLPFPVWLHEKFTRKRSFESTFEAYLYASEVIAAGWCK